MKKLSIPTWNYFNFNSLYKWQQKFYFQFLHGIILTKIKSCDKRLPVLLSIPTWNYFNFFVKSDINIDKYSFNSYMELF